MIKFAQKPNFKFISVFIIFAFVLNFSMTRAEEPSASPESVNQTAIVDSGVKAEPLESAPEISVVSDVPAVRVVGQIEAISGMTDEVGQKADNTVVIDLNKDDGVLVPLEADKVDEKKETTEKSDLEPKSDSEPATETAIGGSESAAAVAGQVTHSIVTRFIRILDIKKLTILAGWQMLDKKGKEALPELDDDVRTGAQFLPSGRYQEDVPVLACVLVGDAGGVLGLGPVSAEIDYPSGIALGDNSRVEKAGCGQLKEQVNLLKMENKEANSLFCENMKNSNNNLVNWNKDEDTGTVYGYGQVCGKGGYLEKQAVAVFCGEASLSYDDPAGRYQLKTEVKNEAGLSVVLDGSFDYLELTSFEADFSSIQYGPVKLNELKELKGDQVWGNESGPTIRNIGNARLQIKIRQNDFGMGKTAGEWNISYQAKVGTALGLASYLPEQETRLMDFLDNGKTVGMDFSVLIKAFPESNKQSDFSGSMVLSADKVPAYRCQP